MYGDAARRLHKLGLCFMDLLRLFFSLLAVFLSGGAV